MGRVASVIVNVMVFENHCRGAIEMLRYEARRIGADAVINLECGTSIFGARGYGTAIAFKNREETLTALKEINAVLK